MNFHKLKENDSVHSPFFYIPPRPDTTDSSKKTINRLKILAQIGH